MCTYSHLASSSTYVSKGKGASHFLAYTPQNSNTLNMAPTPHSIPQNPLKIAIIY